MPNHTHFGRISRALFLGCCFFVSACTVAPVKDRTDIPDKFPKQFTHMVKEVSEHQPFWKESFPSLDLRDDIQTLRNGNFELAAARARVEQAAAEYGLANAAMLKSPSGVLVPLTEVVDITQTLSFTSLARRDGRRIFPVTADIGFGINDDRVEDVLEETVIPALTAA